MNCRLKVNCRKKFGLAYLCMPVSWSYPRHLVHFCEKKNWFSSFFPFRVFFCLARFYSPFLHPFFFLLPFCLRFFFNIISLRQLIVESCASPSNNLISLSYLMPVFSENLFGPFFSFFIFQSCSKWKKLPWGFHIPKIWQILKRFARQFHPA